MNRNALNCIRCLLIILVQHVTCLANEICLFKCRHINRTIVMNERLKSGVVSSTSNQMETIENLNGSALCREIY